MKVQVITGNPEWTDHFETEARRLIREPGETVVSLHYIGSTAIPGIAAKPIIDMLLEVPDVADRDTCHAVISDPGHEDLGEFGTPGRRYFRKSNASGIRWHHLHEIATDSPEIRCHLAFRDYMPAHPEEEHRYGTLKQRPRGYIPTTSKPLWMARTSISGNTRPGTRLAGRRISRS